MTSTAGTLGSDPDERARAVEEQLTDEERFSLLVSVAGSSTVAPSHDTRFPAEVTMCTSYTPGVPRLGVPALLMSDSSRASSTWISTRGHGHRPARQHRARLQLQPRARACRWPHDRARGA